MIDSQKSDISCFSFFANKIITTGEGGAILTDDDEIAEKCTTLRDHGMSTQKRYHHVELGYNYRMTNLQASIGLAQLEKLDEILIRRKRQMDLYYDVLSEVPGISLRKYKAWCNPVHWLMTITLVHKYSRSKFLTYMEKHGVDCRQMINPVHRAEHFRQYYDDHEFPNSIDISERSVHLPSSTGLQEDQMAYIVEKIEAFF